MVDAALFIRRIEAAGFRLELEGGGIAIMPASRLTDPQRQFIRQHKPEILAALSGKVPAPSGPASDILTHPERYEIVEFTDWRLSNGQRVAFKLAIPKERYDGFALLRMLEAADAREVPCAKS